MASLRARCAEDAHRLALCQIHRDAPKQNERKDYTYHQARAVCDLPAWEFRDKWDFASKDALAAWAMDLDDLIRRGDAVEVPPTKQRHAFE